MVDTKLELNILQSYTSTVYDRPGCGYTVHTDNISPDSGQDGWEQSRTSSPYCQSSRHSITVVPGGNEHQASIDNCLKAECNPVSPDWDGAIHHVAPDVNLDRAVHTPHQALLLKLHCPARFIILSPNSFGETNEL